MAEDADEDFFPGSDGPAGEMRWFTVIMETLGDVPGAAGLLRLTASSGQWAVVGRRGPVPGLLWKGKEPLLSFGCTCLCPMGRVGDAVARASSNPA